MKTIRLLADENIARQKVERLTELGFDVVTVADLGLAGQRVPDPTILELANAQGRVVSIHNASDFKRLHKTGAPHAGILILPDDARHRQIADAAASSIGELGEWAGRLVRVSRPEAR